MTGYAKVPAASYGSETTVDTAGVTRTRGMALVGAGLRQSSTVGRVFAPEPVSSLGIQLY